MIVHIGARSTQVNCKYKIKADTQGYYYIEQLFGVWFVNLQLICGVLHSIGHCGGGPSYKYMVYWRITAVTAVYYNCTITAVDDVQHYNQHTTDTSTINGDLYKYIVFELHSHWLYGLYLMLFTNGMTRDDGKDVLGCPPSKHTR